MIDTKAIRPTIVCLCGSTRFGDAFTKAQFEETLAGKIVLTIGCNMRSDVEIFAHMSEQERSDVKRNLDALHMRKIEMADEVLILNVGGYIGESTQNELKHALQLKKTIRFLEPDNDPFWRIKQLETEKASLLSCLALANLELQGVNKYREGFEKEVQTYIAQAERDEDYKAYYRQSQHAGVEPMGFLAWLKDEREKWVAVEVSRIKHVEVLYRAVDRARAALKYLSIHRLGPTDSESVKSTLEVLNSALGIARNAEIL